PAPTTNATANATRSRPPRDRRWVDPRAARAADRAWLVASRVGFGKRPNPARSCRSSSVDIVHLVVGAQLFERARKPGVGRPGRDVEQVGDRGRGVAEPVAQHDDDATCEREPGYRAEECSIAGRA